MTTSRALSGIRTWRSSENSAATATDQPPPTAASVLVNGPPGLRNRVHLGRVPQIQTARPPRTTQSERTDFGLILRWPRCARFPPSPRSRSSGSSLREGMPGRIHRTLGPSRAWRGSLLPGRSSKRSPHSAQPGSRRVRRHRAVPNPRFLKSARLWRRPGRSAKEAVGILLPHPSGGQIRSGTRCRRKRDLMRRKPDKRRGRRPSRDPG